MIKFKDIITEIGDNIQIAPGSSFTINDNGGTVSFKFLSDTYFVDIRLIINMSDKIAVSIDFYANGSAEMTNQNNALKVMSFVLGAIQEWLDRYVKRYGPKELVYIKYDPKKEEVESGNRRDTLYKYYLTKFAKSKDSKVSFSETGGIVAKFEPAIKITT